MKLFKTKKQDKPLDLEKIYNENRHEFEMLLIKDFVGYIPKDVNEPALKVFKEFGEVFERWTLWQSWYVNRRAINDPIKITFYNGMMLYLKVLNTMARVNSKNYIPIIKPKIVEAEVGASNFIDDALKGVSEFLEKNVKSNQNPENKSDGVA